MQRSAAQIPSMIFRANRSCITRVACRRAVFLALLAAGSAARGAEVALAFGIGTVPLLWVAQHGFHRLRRRLTPVALGRVQRGLALVTAVILAWRLHDTLPFGKEEIVEERMELPSCCH